MHPHTGQKNHTWNVYLDCGFWGHPYHDQPCKELYIGKSFYWDNEAWMIPSVYTSIRHNQSTDNGLHDNNMQLKGVVIDFIKKIPADTIRQFLNKWNLHPDSDCEDFSKEQQLLMELEHPLTTNFTPIITLNGSIVPDPQSYTISWNPVFPDANAKEIQDAISHYRLDPAYGWIICRSSFLLPKNDSQAPGHTICRTDTAHNSDCHPSAPAADGLISSLSVQMQPAKQEIPGPHFHTKSPGDSFTFTHPLTGRQHTLTVREYSQERMERMAFHNREQLSPDCFAWIGYTIHPALSPDHFMLADCSESDRPRTLLTHQNPEYSAEYTDFGIIGGADGPTALFLANPGLSDSLHYAASAVHFEPKDETEWRIIFYEQTKTEIRVDLI